ncbi:MAG: hypothetical protein LBO66_11905 [Deltaproteobacteria bacterium]|jgi:site-specific recombinase XerD|nr:hypothetical protein [Deltaproteobacteria bacterium]
MDLTEQINILENCLLSNNYSQNTIRNYKDVIKKLQVDSMEFNDSDFSSIADALNKKYIKEVNKNKISNYFYNLSRRVILMLDLIFKEKKIN